MRRRSCLIDPLFRGDSTTTTTSATETVIDASIFHRENQLQRSVTVLLNRFQPVLSRHVIWRAIGDRARGQ